MATHVVVTDSTFKRAQVKVSPGTYMTDVLTEACKKLGRNPANFGLKNNNKTIDLSLTFRLTGLSAGAKLELIATSRSPSVVSVALQLPQDLAAGVPGGRLVDKFPSDTTLWLVLRKFETTQGTNLNITGRGYAQTESGASGAGRIFYETPVLNIAGREVVDFADLQKTLAQYGVSGGSILIRLTFRETSQPLEEATERISEYFKSAETPQEKVTPKAPVTAATSNTPALESVTEAVANVVSPDSAPAREAPAADGQRTITVFAAPTSSTPKAALQPHNDRDYEPTIQHAKQHQDVLKNSTFNKRLPSYAEQEKMEEERAARLANINEISIQIRFPDMTRIQNTYSATDNALTLYNSVSAVLRYDEPFKLVSAAGRPQPIPIDASKLLVKDLGFEKRVLLNFAWAEGASEKVFKGEPTLKDEYTQRAKELPVPVVQEAEEPAPAAVDKGKGKETDRKEGGVERKNKMMNKILGGLSKK